MDFNDTCAIPMADAAEIRRFLEIVSNHALHAINGQDAGVLQLFRIHPLDEGTAVPSRFHVGDLDLMVETAVADADAGHNVYVEARTVRPGLIGNARGKLEDTAWVFGLVADSDADKGKAGTIDVQATLEVETSPGNKHCWFLFDRAIPAAQAKAIGEALRAYTRADQDTGVVTQPYRIAGTPNYPNATKQARGRVSVEPTRIVAHSGKLWSPDELLAAFGAQARPAAAVPPIQLPVDSDAEATLPADLLELIKAGAPKGKRSDVFYHVIGQLCRRHWSMEAATALLAKYPSGIAAKYVKRLPKEVERAYAKVATSAQLDANFGAQLIASNGSGNGVGGNGSIPPAGVGLVSGPGATAGPIPRTIPTIQLVSGQLPRAVVESERALINSGLPVFARAGTLVHPVDEEMPAVSGYRTRVAKLRAFCENSLTEWLGDAAIFSKFNAKRNAWVDVDAPPRIVRILLVREGRSKIPRIMGVISTPTLRTDGSLIARPGYDAQSELYLQSGLVLPEIPEQPTREQAEAALAILLDLLSEFAFVQELDRAIAVSGILTALVRGSLTTAPLYLIRAHTAGTGKSFLVDVIAAIASGRLCPVITTSRSREELEKRLGAILLDGSSIISLDNLTRDLEGELLCQVCERPIIKIRVLGHSQMPECPCRTALFATGNNVLLTGDLIRRGLTCNLDALVERPELREFKHNPLHEVFIDRGRYVAAGLTVIRAYLTAGAPAVAAPLGSYPDWSRMVRSPLIWLGLPDVTDCMEAAREEDPGLAQFRELVTFWRAYLTLDDDYTVAQIIEAACITSASNDFNPTSPFKDLLLQVAHDRNNRGNISPESLGWWLRKISGRVVDGYRLEVGRRNSARAAYRLTRVGT